MSDTQARPDPALDSCLVSQDVYRIVLDGPTGLPERDDPPEHIKRMFVSNGGRDHESVYVEVRTHYPMGAPHDPRGARGSRNPQVILLSPEHALAMAEALVAAAGKSAQARARLDSNEEPNRE